MRPKEPWTISFSHILPSEFSLLMRNSISLFFFYRQSLSRLACNIISSSSIMEKVSAGADGLNQTTESAFKEACDYDSKKRISDGIMPHILRLYGSCATAVDFEIYAPDASFEDPLMCAQGVKQIKSAFYSLSKVFSESRIVDYSVEENVISPGKQEILINSKQHYKFMGKDIDLASLIRLYVVDGKVVRHEDWWNKKPLWNKETVKLPLLGRVAEMTRRGSMLATHAFMGFGKDPNA